MSLHEKLIEIRKCVEYIQQDAQGYKYDYVSGSALLALLRPAMDKQGVLLIPSVLDYTWTETKTKKGEDLFVVTCKMMMTWVNAEKPEEVISVPFAAFGAQNDISKAYGSALTYSERYFLLKFFNVPSDKLDPDSFGNKNPDNGNPSPSSPPADKPANNPAPSRESSNNPGVAEAGHLQSMWALIDNKGWTEEDAKAWIYEKFDVSTCATLTTSEVNRAMKHFNDNPKTKTENEPPGDNPDDWLPNDKLQAIFKTSDIELKAGGDKIRQYMASQGLTGDEVEAKLERLGIYTSAEAWRVFSEKALITGEEL